MSLVKILPEFVTRPWGCRTLAPLFEMPSGVSDPIGEVWLTSMDCRVARSDVGEKGITLGEFWSQLPAAERGSCMERFNRFPLLLKFIFTAEKLSIQVHPNDDMARSQEGEPWGKTEVWHVFQAEPGAWVKVGFRPEVTAENLYSIWGKPEMEEALNYIPVKAGDTVYVPAGTVHAIGPGLCLCEIQQYSDVTYRVYDYERKGLGGELRDLHLDSAREALRVQAEDAGLVPPSAEVADEAGQELVSTPYFAVERFCLSEAKEMVPDASSIALFIVIGGRGGLRQGEAAYGFKAGDAFLVTAGQEGVVVTPKEAAELLRVRRVSG